MTKQSFCVGSGAGFSGDRLDAAEPVVDTLIANGKPAAMVFETIGERTLALAQLARRQNPETGFEPKLKELLEPVLRQLVCLKRIRLPCVQQSGSQRWFYGTSIQKNTFTRYPSRSAMC